MRRARAGGELLTAVLAVLLLAVAGCSDNQPDAQEAAHASDQMAADRIAADGDAAPPAAGADPAEAAAALNRGPSASETLELDATLAAQGAELFDQLSCNGCHTMGESDTAPDLAGVTGRRTEAWLLRQILDPVWMAENDSITRALAAQYDMDMTDLDVGKDDAIAVLHFLERESR